jgi:hypothetical protein
MKRQRSNDDAALDAADSAASPDPIPTVDVKIQHVGSSVSHDIAPAVLAARPFPTPVARQVEILFIWNQGRLTRIFRLAQGISVGGNVALALGSGSSPAALLDPYGIN